MDPVRANALRTRGMLYGPARYLKYVWPVLVRITCIEGISLNNFQTRASYYFGP